MTGIQKNKVIKALIAAVIPTRENADKAFDIILSVIPDFPQLPYSLSVKDTAHCFGIPRTKLYDMMNNGHIRRGVEYRKLGRKTLIILEGFLAYVLLPMMTEKGFTVEQSEKIIDAVRPVLSPVPPYSFGVSNAALHFGIPENSLYKMISTGRILRGREYLKIGRKVLIIRESFIEFLKREDGLR